MNQVKPRENGYWSLAWAAATILLFKEISNHEPLVFTRLAVGLDVAVGIGLILAFKKFIAEADELQPSLLLNAFAIAFGVGVIVGIPFSVMSAHRVIQIHANIGRLVILQSLTFIASLLYGTWRYR